MKPTEADLRHITQAQGGDVESFRILFDKYHRPVFNFIARMTGNSHDAEDIVQNVFIKIHAKLGSLQEPQAFTSWLFSTARNESINYIRKEKRHRYDSVEETTDSAVESTMRQEKQRQLNPAQLLEDKDLSATVQDALNDIPDIHREAFLLGVLEGHSYKEVAEILDCSVNNVKARVFRARALLTKKLRPYFGA